MSRTFARPDEHVRQHEHAPTASPFTPPSRLSPKIAVPTRTIVAPSSTATSKSWLMPIDSSRPASSPSRRARSRERAQPPEERAAPLGVVEVGRQHHQAIDAQARRAAQRLERGEQLRLRRRRTSSPRPRGPPGRGPAASGRPRPPSRASRRAERRRSRRSGRRRRAPPPAAPCWTAGGRRGASAGRPRARSAERLDLGLGLLHAVLAEVAHAGREGLAHGRRGVRLAHRDEGDLAGGPRRALRRPGDALPDGGHAIRDHFLMALSSPCAVGHVLRVGGAQAEVLLEVGDRLGDLVLARPSACRGGSTPRRASGRPPPPPRRP